MRLGTAAALVGADIVPGDVEIDPITGTIAAVGASPPGHAGLAAPGFVDLQVNGFAGAHLATADEAGYRRVGDALAATGVTAFQPSFITAAEAHLTAALRQLADCVQKWSRSNQMCAQIIGAHLEGPFLAPDFLGVHPAEHRRHPDLGLLERLLAAGPVRQVTLAPELPGALDLVDHLVARGITVSCGHSGATAAEAHAAFDRGATTVTHLFNAMRRPHHREPGLPIAALARDDVTVQVILDGHHLAPDTARLAWAAARGRLALVSDAVGTAPGVDGAVRADDGVLAGSALTMITAVRNLLSLGASLPEALQAASTVPAAIARIQQVGGLAPGQPADLVVLDDTMQVLRTIVGGAEAFAR